MSAISQAPKVLVIDANVAVWIVIPDLAAGGVDAVGEYVSWRKAQHKLVAPSLWLAESTSAIRSAVYSKIITIKQGQLALDDLFALEIEVRANDADLCKAALKWAERLGQIRAYDGFYMALAESLHTELWTADKRLVNAARQIGVNWVYSIGDG